MAERATPTSINTMTAIIIPAVSARTTDPMFRLSY